MVAHIAAIEGRKVKTCDITAAYLNAMIKNAEVLMRLDPTIAGILAELYPEYQGYLNPDGTLVVKLRRALYGCVESAKLWYDLLRKTLKSMGFVRNRKDMCVFNLGTGDKQCTVCFHVDDLMITCTDGKTIDDVITRLQDEFKTITVHDGPKFSYLGMSIDFSESKKVKITMEKYINDVIKDTGTTKAASSPARDNLFEIDPDSPRLGKQDREYFHSNVARLLYLAKRVRPDILCAVSFMCTRVREPTEEDSEKLTRCLRYINNTKHLGIVLSDRDDVAGVIRVSSYIDASYGVHKDGKSHTGAVHSLGKGPISVRSNKQKIVTKSSTEAELVGASDEASHTLHYQEFLKEQGYDMGSAVVYQDNKSCMTLLEKGRSTSDRTRHIKIRYFWINHYIDTKEVKLEYLPTDQMIADILTKPLQGEQFRRLRKMLLNWE
jgi:hypothetical protein